jgi:hypothetical protein
VFPLDWSVGLKLCSNDCEKIFDPFVSLNLEIEELDERNVCQRNKINLNLNVEEFSVKMFGLQKFADFFSEFISFGAASG